MKKEIAPGLNRVICCTLCLLVLISVVFLNMIVEKLPEQCTEFDISSTGLYTFSRQTQETLEALDIPIRLNLIAPDGEEDPRLLRLLRKYAGECDRITAVTVDPVLQSTFVSEYTDNRVTDNSILVTTENGRYRLLRNSDLYPSIYDTATGTAVSGFDGEGQITGAIYSLAVSEDKLFYTLTGHGEQALSETLVSAAAKEGIRFAERNLLTAGQIPDDASGIMCNVPLSDLRENEVEMLRQYLEKGGHFLLATGNTTTRMPNLQKLLQGYGLRMQEGLIIEQKSDFYVPNYPTLLLPQIQQTQITEPLIQENSLVLLPNCHGILTDSDVRNSVTFLPLLQTSASAYLKPLTATTYSYESGDAVGPFCMAMGVTEQTAYSQTRLLWFSTGMFLDDNINEMVAGSNSDLFLNSLSWLAQKEQSITIRAKQQSANLIRLTSAQAMRWGAVFVLALPLSVAVAGIVICTRRKRRV